MSQETGHPGEQTKPEAGLEPTTPLLVSAAGQLEPLSTREFKHATLATGQECLAFLLVTGTGWERRLEGDQMRLLGHLQGARVGPPGLRQRWIQVPEVNTTISPRVKQGTEPEMVTATAMDRGASLLGSRKSFIDGGTNLGQVTNELTCPLADLRFSSIAAPSTLTWKMGFLSIEGTRDPEI